jgi:hypothetical protein
VGGSFLNTVFCFLPPSAFIAFPSLFQYCFPHECSPSCRSRREHDHAARKAISYQLDCDFLSGLPMYAQYRFDYLRFRHHLTAGKEKK